MVKTVYLGLLSFLFFSTANTENCTKSLHHVADKQMQFAGCIIRKSLPAHSCLGCIDQHNDMVEVYNDLVSNSNCSIQILSANRLNIVSSMQRDLVDAWNKGFCDDCFFNGEISNDTKAFSNLNKTLLDCLERNITSKCSKCSGYYEDLNNFYKQMDENRNGQICFDTQDFMNKTRLFWSKTLNCCHREYNLTFFYIASSLFATLPIIFYCGMYSYTKRMERNHEVLDADLNTRHASTSTGVQSGTTSHIEERPIRTDNSSDEDSISKLKKHRDAYSYGNLSKQNSTHPKKGETIKPTSSLRSSSSNQNAALIEL